jgi:hypothetical protein
VFDLFLGFSLAGFAAGFVGYFGLLESAANQSAKALFFFFLGLAVVSVCLGAFQWISRQWGARMASALHVLEERIGRLLRSGSRLLPH